MHADITRVSFRLAEWALIERYMQLDPIGRRFPCGQIKVFSLCSGVRAESLKILQKRHEK